MARLAPQRGDEYYTEYKDDKAWLQGKGLTWIVSQQRRALHWGMAPLSTGEKASLSTMNA
jgi:hypothetical protein